MEEFVQSSGEHGIVVFSLGSMVNNLTDEKSNIIARALSQLPQKVNFLFSLNQLALFFFFCHPGCLQRAFGVSTSQFFHLHLCWMCHGWEVGLCREAEFPHGEFWCFPFSEPNDMEVRP